VRFAVQRERRDPQVLQPLDLGQARQVHEHLLDILADFRMRGQHAEIGVQLGGAFMVVAGAQMNIRHQFRRSAHFFAAQHQRHLAVRFQSDDAVDDLRADRFEALGEVDVRFLVEAGLQLDDHRDFLATPCGVLERIDDDRTDPGAIKRHADRDHLGIDGRLAQELDDRLEALERVVQQNVALLQRLENVGTRREFARPGRHEWLPPQVGLRQLIDELVESYQVDRPVDAEHRLGRQLKLLLQQLLQCWRTSA
jgi:hypothetical protein